MFRVMLHSMDVHKDGTCFSRTFQDALTQMGVRLKETEFDRLLALFCTDHMISYVQFLAYACSNWSIQREDAVKEAYDELKRACAGSILHMATVQARFRPEALTSDLVPNLLEDQSGKEFLSQLFHGVLGPDGVVQWLDFVDYYLDVSMYFDSDRDFCSYVCNSWGIDMDDAVAKKVFRRYASDDNEDVLPEKDFIRMLRELDPTISQAEAIAWYGSIDDDGSGEVSLEEFLSSKVLKVKRLFDEFDTQTSRVATTEEMLVILRGLNGAITDDEALALCRYADIDGDGEVSFSEFLEHRVLKLLQLFAEFAKRYNRSFGETEMQVLLRSQDTHLDETDLRQIYKAVDTDNSGSVSFVEFCESHVLRAKMLFDRYDTDRSHALTEFKFRELLTDMDNSLTRSQMDTIYNLVADHKSGKVYLGGFLNPNVVRIKFLFNKYDRDQSGCLDVTEFKVMLREMFRRASDKDLEALVSAVMPPGHEIRMDFTKCVQRFKDVSHMYDLMQSARRREVRSKAFSKGLAFVGA